MTVSEKILWGHLRKNQLGFGFKRQVPVGRYILDFYCPEAQLCVEVDGEHHRERALQDGMRDDFLQVAGIETIRVPAADLFDCDTPAMERWLQAIAERCSQRSGRV
jgi:very-short-patch-repair endonuclease